MRIDVRDIELLSKHTTYTKPEMLQIELSEIAYVSILNYSL